MNIKMKTEDYTTLDELDIISHCRHPLLEIKLLKSFTFDIFWDFFFFLGKMTSGNFIREIGFGRDSCERMGIREKVLQSSGGLTALPRLIFISFHNESKRSKYFYFIVTQTYLMRIIYLKVCAILFYI